MLIVNYPSINPVIKSFYNRLNNASSVIATGPCRTADIEMALTIGVHGPGEVHVFLIDDFNVN